MLRETIRKYALENAVKYNGKAAVGSIIGKLINEDPSIKDKLNVINKEIQQVITEVNKLSQGQSNVFSVLDAQVLLDVKAFYEYNPINNGVLEFIARLLTNPKTKKELQNIYGPTKIALMHDQILVHASYMQFLQEIRSETDQAFFTKEGFQNKNRETTFDEFVTKYFFPEQYIPEEQPAPETPETPTPETQSKETGGQPEALNVTQPTPEELLGQPKPEQKVG